GAVAAGGAMLGRSRSCADAGLPRIRLRTGVAIVAACPVRSELVRTVSGRGVADTHMARVAGLAYGRILADTGSRLARVGLRAGVTIVALRAIHRRLADASSGLARV